MTRAAALLIADDAVALIERVRDQQVYYVFPGGQVEADETPEAAVVREVYGETFEKQP